MAESSPKNAAKTYPFEKCLILSKASMLYMSALLNGVQ